MNSLISSGSNTFTKRNKTPLNAGATLGSFKSTGGGYTGFPKLFTKA